MRDGTTGREKIVVAAWKTYLTLAGSECLAREIAAWAARSSGAFELVLTPPFLHIAPVRRAVGDAIAVGAQNLDLAGRGAYTGQTPPQLLIDAGCSYVLLGHSELRRHMGETDALLRTKVAAALGEAGLRVILCIGESYAQKSAGTTLDVLKSQLDGCLKGIRGSEAAGRLDIAYEPIWAISSESPTSPPEARHVNALHLKIRKTLARLLGGKAAEKVRILYGGSVSAANVGRYLQQSEIDGVLVGSASTRLPDVLELLDAARRSILEARRAPGSS